MARSGRNEMTSLMRQWVWVGIVILSTSRAASAHDPFDGATRLIVHDNRIELMVTMGSEASREFLRAAGLRPHDVSILTMRGPVARIDVPVTLARRLFDVKLDAAPLDAEWVTGQSGEGETIFVAAYPRPTVGSLLLRAAYFDGIDSMRSGSFVARDDKGHELARALLSRSAPSVEVPLPGGNTTVPADHGSPSHAGLPSLNSCSSAWNTS
jgi:hypothetical protein